MEGLMELSTALTGLGTIGIIWAARLLSKWVNGISRPKKWLLNYAFVTPLLTALSRMAGIEIESLEGLIKPGVAQSVSSSVVAMTVWQMAKQLMRWKNRYNTTLDGQMTLAK